MLVSCAKNLYTAANRFVALAANHVGYSAQAEQVFLSATMGSYSPFSGKAGVAHYKLSDLRGAESLRAVAAGADAKNTAYAGRCTDCGNVSVASSYEALGFCTDCGAENIVDTVTTAYVAVAEGIDMSGYDDLIDDGGAFDSVASTISDMRFDTDEARYGEFDRMVRNNSARAGVVDLDTLSLAGDCGGTDDDDFAEAGDCGGDADEDLDDLAFASDYEEGGDSFVACKATASDFRTMDELFSGAGDLGEDGGEDDEDMLTFSVAGDCDPDDPDCDSEDDGEDDGDVDDLALSDGDGSFDIPDVELGFSDVTAGLTALDGGDEVTVNSLDSYPALAADSVSFRFSQSADPNNNAWIAFANNHPFAMASAGLVPEKLKPMFDTEQYRNNCYAAIAASGATGLKSLGFYGFTQKFNVGNSLRDAANQARAVATAEYQAALKQRDEEMMECIATQAVAMDRGFGGMRNPLKDSIVQTAVASGLDGSLITRIVNQAFASHGSEYAETLLRSAENFRQKPKIVREELTQAIASANYNDGVPAAPARQGLSSAVASVTPSLVSFPAQSEQKPAQQMAAVASTPVVSNGFGVTTIANGLVRING